MLVTGTYPLQLPAGPDREGPGREYPSSSFGAW